MMKWKMNITRPVEWFKYDVEYNNEKKEQVPTTVSQGYAIFHQFGSDFFETPENIAAYSTAIIELKDGTVKNIPVNLIKFLDRE